MGHAFKSLCWLALATCAVSNASGAEEPSRGRFFGRRNAHEFKTTTYIASTSPGYTSTYTNSQGKPTNIIIGIPECTVYVTKYVSHLPAVQTTTATQKGTKCATVTTKYPASTIKTTSYIPSGSPSYTTTIYQTKTTPGTIIKAYPSSTITRTRCLRAGGHPYASTRTQSGSCPGTVSIGIFCTTAASVTLTSSTMVSVSATSSPTSISSSMVVSSTKSSSIELSSTVNVIVSTSLVISLESSSMTSVAASSEFSISSFASASDSSSFAASSSMIEFSTVVPNTAVSSDFSIMSTAASSDLSSAMESSTMDFSSAIASSIEFSSAAISSTMDLSSALPSTTMSSDFSIMSTAASSDLSSAMESSTMDFSSAIASSSIEFSSAAISSTMDLSSALPSTTMSSDFSIMSTAASSDSSSAIASSSIEFSSVSPSAAISSEFSSAIASSSIELSSVSPSAAISSEFSSAIASSSIELSSVSPSAAISSEFSSAIASSSIELSSVSPSAAISSEFSSAIASSSIELSSASPTAAISSEFSMMSSAASSDFSSAAISSTMDISSVSPSAAISSDFSSAIASSSIELSSVSPSAAISSEFSSAIASSSIELSSVSPSAAISSEFSSAIASSSIELSSVSPSAAISSEFSSAIASSSIELSSASPTAAISSEFSMMSSAASSDFSSAAISSTMDISSVSPSAAISSDFSSAIASSSIELSSVSPSAAISSEFSSAIASSSIELSSVSPSAAISSEFSSAIASSSIELSSVSPSAAISSEFSSAIASSSIELSSASPTAAISSEFSMMSSAASSDFSSAAISSTMDISSVSPSVAISSDFSMMSSAASSTMDMSSAAPSSAVSLDISMTVSAASSEISSTMISSMEMSSAAASSAISSDFSVTSFAISSAVPSSTSLDVSSSSLPIVLPICVPVLPPSCLSLTLSTSITVTVDVAVCLADLIQLNGNIQAGVQLPKRQINVGPIVQVTECLAVNALNFVSGQAIVDCLNTAIVCPSSTTMGMATATSVPILPTLPPLPICLATLPAECLSLSSTNSLSVVVDEALCTVALALQIDVAGAARAASCLLVNALNFVSGQAIIDCLGANVLCPSTSTISPSASLTLPSLPTLPTLPCLPALPASCLSLSSTNIVLVVVDEALCAADLLPQLDVANVAKATICLAVTVVDFVSGQAIVDCLNTVLCSTTTGSPSASLTLPSLPLPTLPSLTLPSLPLPTLPSLTLPSLPLPTLPVCLPSLPPSCLSISSTNIVTVVAQEALCTADLLLQLDVAQASQAAVCLAVTALNFVSGQAIVDCLDTLLCTPNVIVPSSTVNLLPSLSVNLLPSLTVDLLPSLTVDLLPSLTVLPTLPSLPVCLPALPASCLSISSTNFLTVVAQEALCTADLLLQLDVAQASQAAVCLAVTALNFVSGQAIVDCLDTLLCTPNVIVPSSTVNLLPSLSVDLLPSLTVDLLPSLSVDLLPSLTVDLLPSLTVDLLPSLSVDLLPSLTVDLLPSLTVDLLPSLTVLPTLPSLPVCLPALPASCLSISSTNIVTVVAQEALCAADLLVQLDVTGTAQATLCLAVTALDFVSGQAIVDCLNTILCPGSTTTASPSAIISLPALPTLPVLPVCLPSLPASCSAISSSTPLTVVVDEALCTAALALQLDVPGTVQAAQCLAVTALNFVSGQSIVDCLNALLCPGSTTTASPSAIISLPALPTLPVLPVCLPSLPASCSAISSSTPLTVVVDEALCTAALALQLDVPGTVQAAQCLVVTALNFVSGQSIVDCLNALLCPSTITAIAPSSTIFPTIPSLPALPICLDTLPAECLFTATTSLTVVLDELACTTQLALQLDVPGTVQAAQCLVVTALNFVSGQSIVDCLNALLCPSTITAITPSSTIFPTIPSLPALPICLDTLPAECLFTATTSITVVLDELACTTQLALQLDILGTVQAATCLAVGVVDFVSGQSIVDCLSSKILCSGSSTIAPVLPSITLPALPSLTLPTIPTLPALPVCLAALPAGCLFTTTNSLSVVVDQLGCTAQLALQLDVPGTLQAATCLAVTAIDFVSGQSIVDCLSSKILCGATSTIAASATGLTLPTVPSILPSCLSALPAGCQFTNTNSLSVVVDQIGCTAQLALQLDVPGTVQAASCLVVTTLNFVSGQAIVDCLNAALLCPGTLPTSVVPSAVSILPSLSITPALPTLPALPACLSTLPAACQFTTTDFVTVVVDQALCTAALALELDVPGTVQAATCLVVTPLNFVSGQAIVDCLNAALLCPGTLPTSVVPSAVSILPSLSISPALPTLPALPACLSTLPAACQFTTTNALTVVVDQALCTAALALELDVAGTVQATTCLVVTAVNFVSGQSIVNCLNNAILCPGIVPTTTALSVIPSLSISPTLPTLPALPACLSTLPAACQFTTTNALTVIVDQALCTAALALELDVAGTVQATTCLVVTAVNFVSGQSIVNCLNNAILCPGIVPTTTALVVVPSTTALIVAPSSTLIAGPTCLSTLPAECSAIIGTNILSYAAQQTLCAARLALELNLVGAAQATVCLVNGLTTFTTGIDIVNCLNTALLCTPTLVSSSVQPAIPATSTFVTVVSTGLAPVPRCLSSLPQPCAAIVNTNFLTYAVQEGLCVAALALELNLGGAVQATVCLTSNLITFTTGIQIVNCLNTALLCPTTSSAVSISTVAFPITSVATTFATSTIAISVIPSSTAVVAPGLPSCLATFPAQCDFTGVNAGTLLARVNTCRTALAATVSVPTTVQAGLCFVGIVIPNGPSITNCVRTAVLCP